MARVYFLSCLLFSCGRACYSFLWVAPSFCVAQRGLRTSTALSSFLHHCTSVENSLSFHNTSNSFSTGCFSAILFALFASAVFCGISFPWLKKCVFTGHHFIVFSVLNLFFFLKKLYARLTKTYSDEKVCCSLISQLKLLIISLDVSKESPYLV